MCFADDLLLFTKWDKSSIQQLMRVFQKFSLVSGLCANQSKSCIYFGGIKIEEQTDILQEFGMAQGELPFKYLGVPLSTKKLTVVQCQPLIKKILDRVECWSSKLLSYAGRIQLIKSVIFGVQSYWSQIFLLPKKVLKAIQTACRVFLWTGASNTSKRALVAWDQICMPQFAGGWNVTDLSTWNKAALCKLLRKLIKKKDSLLIKWIHGYYVKHNNILNMRIPKAASWIVKKIIGARDYMQLIPPGLDILAEPHFLIGKVYTAMRGQMQKVPWQKLLSYNVAPPNYVFILWLVMKGGLSTSDQLQKYGIQVNLNCCLCERGIENVDHLFFGCQFAAEIWNKLANWCGVKRKAKVWRLEQGYLLTQCKAQTGSQKLYRLLVTVVVNLVWRERNRRIFQEVKQEVEHVVKEGQMVIAVSCSKDMKLDRILRAVTLNN